VLDLVDPSNRILAPFSFPSFQNEYAARVQDFRSYHSICRDIVTRWVYPLVPDAQLLPGSTYTHTKRYTYREQGVKVSRSAVIGEAVVLSRGAVVGDNAQLRRTIVGRDCVIGANTKISNSHIWKGMYSVRTDGMVVPCISAVLQAVGAQSLLLLHLPTCALRCYIPLSVLLYCLQLFGPIRALAAWQLVLNT
jgi:hypothetical protein